MPTTSEALVTPTILRWARERARTSQGELAKKLNTNPERIALWESGQTRPTFRQAQNIASKLRIPFGYLYLPAPPAERIPLQDFRTVRDVEMSSPSGEFLDLLYDVIAKQSWYRELLEDEEAEELPFVACFSLNDEFHEIAASIASTLGIDDTFRQAASSWESFLRNLMERTESIGVLVMRSGLVAGNTRRRVSEKEFRGFAISDKLAPLIFINGNDAKAAQIFTLAHELAHIWVGQTGISNESPADFSQNEVEKKCNQVAAEVLVPRVEFIRHWSSTRDVDSNLNDAVRHFRVSLLVVLRRTLELELLPADVVWSRYRQEEERRAQPAKGGGDFFRNLLSRNSRLLVEAVVNAVQGERALYTEAASLLNVRPSTIPKIAKFLANT
jgi:Zn-dependent peptidase ImmA (M78 family)/DNA-binding XRE family transcriptional regulator